MMTVVATAVQGFEERYTLYRSIFLYCGIAALVFLAIAIILFFVLKIPQVFGELTGRTARKAVEERTGVPVISAKNAAQLNQVVTNLIESAESFTDSDKKAEK